MKSASIIALLLLTVAGPGLAQNLTVERKDLEKQVQNPVASLIGVPGEARW
jgi:hypothetical protein